MAHQAQVLYCIRIKSMFPSYFRFKKVLDVGSLDVNGNNRYLFFFCKYWGIDIGPGDNVDEISLGHEFKAPPASYDTIISTEVFEHDRHYEKTIANIVRMLRPGGLFVFTCATTGRPEHGTKRTDVHSSPFTTDYYLNVTEEMVRRIPGFNEAWQVCGFEVEPFSCDLRFYGIKKGGPVRFNPSILRVITNWLFYFYCRRMRDFKKLLQRLFGKPEVPMNKFPYE